MKRHGKAARSRGRLTMNSTKLETIRKIAERNGFLAAAKTDPLNADAVRRAVESRAELAGYERAIREVVDGMISLAVAS